MYRVSAQGVDECMIYIYIIKILCKVIDITTPNTVVVIIKYPAQFQSSKAFKLFVLA